MLCALTADQKYSVLLPSFYACDIDSRPPIQPTLGKLSLQRVLGSFTHLARYPREFESWANIRSAFYFSCTKVFLLLMCGGVWDKSTSKQKTLLKKNCACRKTISDWKRAHVQHRTPIFHRQALY